MHRLPRSLTLRQHHHLLPRRPLPSRQAQTPHRQQRHKSTILYEPTGEPVRFQTVRFRRPPFFSYSRFGSLVIYSVFFYAAFQYTWPRYGFDIEFDDDEEGQEITDEAVAQAEEEEEGEYPFWAAEDSTFIPLTWASKLPRSYYRGSDPEWQEFIRIARSTPTQKKINAELVQIIFSASSTHPIISRQIGAEPKVGKFWLDITFPDGPPQEYIRSGLEIGDGYIAWSQQRVSQEHQWALMRAIWPEAAAGSVWATGKVLVGMNLRRLKKAIGYEEVDPTAPEERFRAAMEMMQKRSKAQTDPEGSPGEVVRRADASAPPSLPVLPSQSDGSHPRASPSGKDAAPTRTYGGLPLPSVPLPFGASKSNNTNDPSSPESVPHDLPIALHVFQHSLAKAWNPKKSEPPRGTFIVQGLVEVRGQRGRMLFDVQSAYDPKQGKFAAVSVGIRGFKKWSQGPRGGPG